MRDRPTRVLFVCTGNSARSLLAEALLRTNGGTDFEAHSAGTAPKGVHPLTLRVLDEAGIPTDGFRSKPLSEHTDESFDYVITVCDNAREACPTFPGGPAPLHWSYDDPATEEGSEDERLDAFRRTLTAMAGQIDEFIAVALRNRAGEAGVR